MLAVAVGFQPHEPDAGDSAGMRIDFGYGQEPLSRSLTFPLCRDGDLTTQLAYPECAAGADLAKLQRPEVKSAIPAGDLLPAQTRAGCPDIRGGSAFPSQQLEVTASNFDVQGLTLAVTADPTTPERVSPGTYCGTLVVTRAAGGLIEQPIVITLGDRWQLLIVYRVIFSLFLGAAIGALLKWVGDNIRNPDAGSVPVPGRSATPLHWVRCHAGLVLGLATALAVALTGATSQYIQDATFNDDFLDYFALLIWALTGQLAGQTLIDIAGNVKPSVEDRAAEERTGARRAAPTQAAQERASVEWESGQRVPASASSIRSIDPTETDR
jgi:hypothetical protein